MLLCPVGYFKNSLSNAPKTRTDRDILEETITAMHAKGIKVYAWLTIGIDNAYQEAHPEQSSYHFRRGFSGVLRHTSAEEDAVSRICERRRDFINRCVERGTINEKFHRGLLKRVDYIEHIQRHTL